MSASRPGGLSGAIVPTSVLVAGGVFVAVLDHGYDLFQALGTALVFLAVPVPVAALCRAEVRLTVGRSE